MADSSEELLQRALQGHREALHSLARRLAPVIQARVVRVLLRYRRHLATGSPQQEVEDRMQEVFAALFAHEARALRAWDPARGASLEGFVGLFAERQVVTLLRSGRTNPRIEAATAAEDLERVGQAEGGDERRFLAKEAAAALLARLEQELSPKGVEVFDALFLQELPVEEAAEALGMTRDALYTWRGRIGKLARRIVEEWSGAS